MVSKKERVKNFIFDVLWFLLKMVIVAGFFISAFFVVVFFDITSPSRMFVVIFIGGYICQDVVSSIERKRRERVLCLKIKKDFPVVEEAVIKEKI